MSERTVHTSVALLGEGRQLLQERVDAPSPPRPGQLRTEQSGTQQMTPAAGLVRRKAEGVQMATFATPAPVPRFPKDE